MKIALLTAIALTAGPAAAGPCLVDGLAPQIMTPSGSTIDQYGGIVVAAVSSPMHREQRADPTRQAWQFKQGAKRIKSKIRPLAPGLSLYSPEGDPVGAKVELEGVTVDIGFMVTDDMPMDEAPKVTAIQHTKRGPMLREEQTVATLSGPPPAGTVALIVYDEPMKALARSFVLVTDPKATSITIYGKHRCEAAVPGTVPTRAGATVRLAWVDAEGHVSIPTAPIKVTKLP